VSLNVPSQTGTMMTVGAVLDDDVIRVRLAGTADAEAKVDLEVLAKKLHEEAQRLHTTKIVVDLRELEFMNSSCFKAFVHWLTQIQDLEIKQQYRLHFVSNPNLHWQRRSLAALSCFAVDLVTIET
jgi:anti-anti-sigma factor